MKRKSSTTMMHSSSDGALLFLSHSDVKEAPPLAPLGNPWHMKREIIIAPCALFLAGVVCMLVLGTRSVEPPMHAPRCLASSIQSANMSTLELVNIEGWRDTMRLVAAQLPQINFDGHVEFDREGPSGQLVTASGEKSNRFIIEGFNADDGLLESISIHGQKGIDEFSSLFQAAVDLRLNTVRIKAYSHHIHPMLNQVNEAALRSLDSLILLAASAHLRVILVLSGVHGETIDPHGAAQISRWINPAATLTDFFANDTHKARYFDFISSIVLRNNTLTGLRYHQDPTIIAWDLMENVRLPGGLHSREEPGDLLQAWIAWVGSFLKELKGESPQLVMISSHGLFGPFSPHHMKHNPSPASISMSQPECHVNQPPLLTKPSCDGNDFMRNNALWQVDVAHFSITPTMSKPSLELPQCKEWLTEWIKAHLRDALRMQKPVLISYSSGSYHTVREMLDEAEKMGIAVAGSILRSIQDHPRYSATEIAPSHPMLILVNKSAECVEAEAEEARRFMNYDQMNLCWSANGLLADPPLSIGEELISTLSGMTRRMLRRKQYDLKQRQNSLAMAEAY